MPATPKPVVNPRLGPYTSTVQAFQYHGQQLRAQAAAQQQSGTFDQYMNCVELSGANLDQVVTIGAGHMNGGVEVGTGQPAPPNTTAGRIRQTNLATGTITLTAASTAATLASTTSGTFTSGQVIGAATATATNAIQPGTTFTISGTSITLSQPALVSGTGLYAAACSWQVV